LAHGVIVNHFALFAIKTDAQLLVDTALIKMSFKIEVWSAMAIRSVSCVVRNEWPVIKK